MNLQTFTILINFVFVICDVPSPRSYGYYRQDTYEPHLLLDSVSIEEEHTYSPKAPNFDDTDEHDSDNSAETTTTENPENNNETTTEHTIETTSNDDVRDCPRGQSSFSKQDLVIIINYFSDVQYNIMSNISDAYNDTAIQARDKLLQEFNDFKTKLMDRPNHLIHVLDDMEDTRQKKIVPLAKTAAATLQEFPAVENDFNRLYNKTMKSLDDLEKYKKICELNNCNPQLLRSSFPLSANGVLVTKRKVDENNMCSTIENVHTTIRERLFSYEQEEIDRLKKYISDNEEILEKAITILKDRLRETAVSEFGITMYEILNLQDDHFHFMNTLIDFNAISYTNNLKKKNMNIEFKLLDLDSNIQRYRQYCLSCGQVQRRRRFATYKTDVESIVNVSDKNETNILDQLISDKIDEIGKVVQANIKDIFKQLNDTVNDRELVENTVAQLKPIQEGISQRTVAEKQALEALIKSVPKETREHAKNVQLKATALVDSLNKANAFFPKRNRN